MLLYLFHVQSDPFMISKWVSVRFIFMFGDYRWEQTEHKGDHWGIRCLTLYFEVSLYWVMGLSAIPHVPTPTFPFTLSGDANILLFTWRR